MELSAIQDVIWEASADSFTIRDILGLPTTTVDYFIPMLGSTAIGDTKRGVDMEIRGVLLEDLHLMEENSLHYFEPFKLVQVHLDSDPEWVPTANGFG